MAGAGWRRSTTSRRAAGSWTAVWVWRARGTLPPPSSKCARQTGRELASFFVIAEVVRVPDGVLLPFMHRTGPILPRVLMELLLAFPSPREYESPVPFGARGGRDGFSMR